LTAYLRGRAEMAQHHPERAATQFRVVLAHPGAAFLGGSVVYPMAEIQLARERAR
jgi:hypothetical protein